METKNKNMTNTQKRHEEIKREIRTLFVEMVDNYGELTEDQKESFSADMRTY